MGIKEKVAGLGTKTLMVLAAFMVVVSAATVAYLSNEVTIGANVDHPFQVTVTGTSSGTCVDGACTLTGLTGGSEFTVSGKLNNNANLPITASTKVVCDDNVGKMTCAQLTMSHSSCMGDACTPGELETVTCVDHGTVGTDAYVEYPIVTWTFPAHHVSNDNFKGILASGFYGDLDCEIIVTPS